MILDDVTLAPANKMEKSLPNAPLKVQAN